MQRKTRPSRRVFPFTVRALSLSCKEAILEKADEQNINVKKVGRPKLRLYFACSNNKWRPFYHQIRKFCTVEERPVMCRCPRWLQKVMLKNLSLNTRDGAVGAIRARKSSEILKRLSRSQ